MNSVIEASLSVTFFEATAPVPSGELWEIQAWEAWDLDSNPTYIEFRIVGGGNTVQIERFNSPGLGIHVVKSGRWVVGPGNYLGVRFAGVQANDDLYSQIWYAKLVG